MTLPAGGVGGARGVVALPVGGVTLPARGVGGVALPVGGARGVALPVGGVALPVGAGRAVRKDLRPCGRR